MQQCNGTGWLETTDSLKWHTASAMTVVDPSAGANSVHTRVLLSSIFFIADSVVRGYLMMAHASSFSAGGLLHNPTECHTQ